MRSKGMVMLVIALIAGLAAVALAATWLRNQGGGKGQIAVAAADVELGGRIGAEQVRMVDWPAAAIPPGAFEEAKLVEGRVTVGGLQRGEPILEARLAPVGTKGGLSAVVTEGKRAMTVRVNDVVGVAGFALPGNYVDILVNTQEEANRINDPRPVSKIVLERILVLAVAQEADRDSTKPKVVNAVTLEVAPGQAELLDLARSVGTLSLVLRNQADPNPAATAGVTKNELLGRAVPAAAPASAAPVRRVAAARPMAEPSRREGYCVDVIRQQGRVSECF